MRFPVVRIIPPVGVPGMSCVRKMSSMNMQYALKDIETRWHLLPEVEKGAIADVLAEKHKGDWKKMSLDEKRASYWMCYGTHGKRNPRDPAFWYRVLSRASVFIVACTAVGVYATNKVASKRVESTPEWSAYMSEYIRKENINPVSMKSIHDQGKKSN